MSLHFEFPAVERGTLTPPSLQEQLVVGVAPKEVKKAGWGRVVNFLKDMADAAIAGAQMFSSLYDPRKWQR